MPAERFPQETLPQFVRSALETPRDDAFVERGSEGWVATSSARALERVENLACAIRAAGLAHGDRLALVGHDCVDWIVCSFATSFAGCVVVPLYPTQAADHTHYILEHSGAKLIFAGSAAVAERLRSSGAPAVRIVTFGEEGADGLAAFEAGGAAIRAARPDLPRAYESEQRPGDMAVLIYTSGTTGSPKGVMLSHDNIAFNVRSASEYTLEGIGPGSPVLSMLPFSHIFEHAVVYVYLRARVRHAICRDPGELLADLRDVRPMTMTCVPRVFERVLAGAAERALRRGGAQARLVPWALRAAREYARARTFEAGAPVPLRLRHAIARLVVLDRMRRALGLDRMKYFTSGSATLHADVAMTFLGMGLPIVEGYGLTETSPVISVNRLSANRYGTVGCPIPEVEVRVADDGEILTRGRHVMMGYYRDPDATAEALRDGWFHTGDVGALDADGCVRVTDRKKETFKTTGGRFVSPARVEAAAARSIFISQILVTGRARAFPIAMVCPNWDAIRTRFRYDAAVSAEDLAARQDVLEFVRSQLQTYTADLAAHERIRHAVVLARPFSVEGGELSPSMKVKRRVVESLYADRIDAAYEAARQNAR